MAGASPVSVCWPRCDDDTYSLSTQHFSLLAGCSSLAVAGPHVWAGTEDGCVLVYDASQVALLSQTKPHTDRVSCLECVGSHVWSGSGDRTIAAHDAHSFQTLYSLGDQGAPIDTRFLFIFFWGIDLYILCGRCSLCIVPHQWRIKCCSPPFLLLALTYTSYLDVAACALLLTSAVSNAVPPAWL